MSSLISIGRRLGLLAIAVSGFSACAPLETSTSLENSPSYATESAVALINSLATDSERGTFATLSPNSMSCGSFNPRSSCNQANQITVDWQDCFFPVGEGRLKGGWVSTYNNANACAQAQTGELRSGESVTRTSSGLTIEGYYGGKLTFDTNAHSAYDTTTIPAGGASVANNGGTRTINIVGAHRVLRGKDDNVKFDISITTPSPLLMTGERSNGTRSLFDGTGSIRIYNNLEQYRSTSTLVNVKWTNSACCYPTSGTITTTFSDSKTGTSQLAFSNSCGSAEFTDTDGTRSQVTLVQCE